MFSGRFKLVLLFYVFLFLVSFSCVKAEKIGIAVSDSIISLDTRAGEEQMVSFKIQNIFSKNQKVEVEFESYDIIDDNERVPVVLGNEQSINDWIILENNNFLLEPNESKDFSFKAKVPANAKSGSYQGILFFQISSDEKKNNSVNEVGRIGVYVLINVIDGIKFVKGEIVEFKTSKFIGSEVNVNLKYKNEGNVHFVPKGEIVVENLWKKKKLSARVEEHFVFPDKEFNFQEKRKGFFYFGIYKVRASFTNVDGTVHEKSQYVIGYLFLPLLIGFIFLFIIIKKIFKKGSFKKKFEKNKSNKFYQHNMKNNKLHKF